MKRKLLFTVCCLLFTLLVLPSIWPLFRPDFFKMHDYTHVARLHQMDKALKDGHIPPRWAKDLGWGYGMPLFNFYAPLPYYVAEIFHLLGFSFLNSIKICFALTFFISFMGMFFLAKKFWGVLGGFLSALAFTYSPYRAVDFYVRGALGELFGIGLIPWAIWAIFELIDQKDRKFLPLTAIILSCLFLSHTVLTLICFPLLVIISLFYLLLSKRKLRKVIYTLTAFVLSLGLTSFFLLPAFFEKDFTQVNQLTTGFSYYAHHFLYFRQFLYGNWGYGGSVDGIEDLMSFHLGKGHLLLVSITLLFCLFRAIFKKKIEKRTLVIAFFTTLILVFAFLSTYHAKPIWDAIPLMAFIQFPWRFNSLIIVFIGLLAGGGCFYLKKIGGKKAALLFLPLSILMILKVNTRYFRPEEYINPNDFYYTDEKLIKKSMSGIIPDYVPIWVEKEPKEIAISDYQIISGDPKVEVIESKTHKLLLKISTDEESIIQLNRFYFPGWQTFINNKKIPFDYEKNNGIITLSLPSGRYILKLTFEKTPIRKSSEIISIMSVLLTFFLIIVKKYDLKMIKSRRND